MAFKNGLIKALGGRTQEDYDKFMRAMQFQLEQIVEKNEMQNAWNELKQQQRMAH